MPIKNYSKGAQKALAAMQKRYGAKKGKQVFYAKANEKGSGKTMMQKANSIYKKGARYPGSTATKTRKTKTKRRRRKVSKG
jgi:hypothetical protein